MKATSQIGFLILAYFFCTIFNSRASSTEPNPSVQILTRFAKGKIPPFSFVYDGKPSASFIKSWTFKEEKLTAVKPNTKLHRFIYQDPKTGLKVTCDLTLFTDFPALEWTLHFTNTSAAENTPVIEKANAIDYHFDYKSNGVPNLHHALGSDAGRSDFQPLLSELNNGKTVYMTPSRGRSSDGKGFPFFNIETPDKKGVMVAIGWTGKWFAEVGSQSQKNISLKAGMENLKLYLMPGEKIRTPQVCLLFWQGEDRMLGHNQFRKFMLSHHTRKVNGEIPQLPLASFLDREGPEPCNEHVCATEINAIAEIKRHQQFDILPEVFWLDAGWYKCNGHWWNVGNWTPNETNFPNGLKPVADVVKQVGAKFLLWFEPERIIKNESLTTVDKVHPDWVTSLENDVNLLYNLGNEEARLAMTAQISEMIQKNGIAYYRQDFNIDPYPFWKKMDKDGRQGMAEIRHIEGLYAFWDSLLAKFPNLIIDNCASGGRRLDLETMSRSTPFWRTDYAYGEPIGSQSHTYGLNFYLPLTGTGNFEISPYHFRSAMSSHIVINWDVNSKHNKQADMKALMEEFKLVRPFYYHSDYYPLTDTNGITTDDIWLAYQLNRSGNKDGIVMAFRRPGSKNETIKVKLKGVNATASYELLNKDTKEVSIKSGKDLLEGIELNLTTAPASVLLMYKEKGVESSK